MDNAVNKSVKSAISEFFSLTGLPKVRSLSLCTDQLLIRQTDILVIVLFPL